MKKYFLFLAVTLVLVQGCQTTDNSKKIGSLIKKTTPTVHTFILYGLTNRNSSPFATFESKQSINEPCAEGEILTYSFKSQHPIKLSITSNGETLAVIEKANFEGTVEIPKKGNPIPVYCRFEFSSISSNHTQVQFTYR